MPLADSFHRVIFDVVPIPLFVCDGDIHILHANVAAETAFGGDAGLVLNLRGGETLHCLHSTESSEGCGHSPSCKDCVIRNSVTACLAGETVQRRRMKFQRTLGTTSHELDLLITTSAVPGKSGLVLIVVEDVSEFVALKSLIPICMKCKRVRTDDQYWQDLETYFHHFVGVDFSHGICPVCRELYYPASSFPEEAREPG